MPRVRPLALALAVAALVAVPTAALAADDAPPSDAPAIAAVVEIAGIAQLPDGTPVGDVTVTVLVVGDDVISQGVTGADGAFALSIDAQPGDVLEIGGVGPLVAVGTPTPEGCLARRAVTGELELTVGDAPPDPVTLVLDGALDAQVCTATATPAIHSPAVTPPATDTAASGATPATRGTGLVLAALGLLAAGALVAARRRDAATRPR